MSSDFEYIYKCGKHNIINMVIRKTLDDLLGGVKDSAKNMIKNIEYKGFAQEVLEEIVSNGIVYYGHKASEGFAVRMRKANDYNVKDNDYYNKMASIIMYGDEDKYIQKRGFSKYAHKALSYSMKIGDRDSIKSILEYVPGISFKTEDVIQAVKKGGYNVVEIAAGKTRKKVGKAIS